MLIALLSVRQTVHALKVNENDIIKARVLFAVAILFTEGKFQL